MEMVAAQLGVGFWTVRETLRHAGVVRTKSEAAILAYAKGRRRAFRDHNRVGPDNPNWKGGRWSDKNGYVWVRCGGHPHATTHGSYVLKHRLVMEAHLGRYLDRDELVHHVNEIVSDNSLQNLRIMSRSEHSSYHQQLLKA